MNRTLKNEEIRKHVLPLVRLALSEDIGEGDVTTLSTVSADTMAEAEIVSKADGVVAGLFVVGIVFGLIDGRVELEFLTTDGAKIRKGEVLAIVKGPARAILSGERVALNFLQRMSGIATATSCFVEAVKPYTAKILDTRKTVPGQRFLDKLAVSLGGGVNHRFGLFDMVLIKDNHIVAAGGITEAVRRVRGENKRCLLVEVEVKDLDELSEALFLRPDRILLDNMSVPLMKKAVEITSGKVPLEASGGVTLETVSEIAATGVDFISVGALTHSVSALDISLEITSLGISKEN